MFSPTTMPARGVKGIVLASGDRAVGMVVVREGGSLYTVCENGFGKRTLFSEYRRQHRGGRGLIDIRTTERNGKVVAALSIVSGDDVMIMTTGGMLVRIQADDARDIGRNTQGVRLIRVKEGDKVSGAEKVEPDKDKDKDEDSEVEPGPVAIPEATGDGEHLPSEDAEGDEQTDAEE